MNEINLLPTIDFHRENFCSDIGNQLYYAKIPAPPGGLGTRVWELYLPMHVNLGGNLNNLLLRSLE